MRGVDALGSGSDPADEPDLNRQLEKLAFLKESRESGYLQRELTAPRSAFELKTGTVIPSVLLSELNSDLPGEIVAQVAQNVYDTASGNHLLIPQGTKVFGHYDSRVAFGQGRLLVSWQRLIFPDASILELDGGVLRAAVAITPRFSFCTNGVGTDRSANPSVMTSGLPIGRHPCDTTLRNPTGPWSSTPNMLSRRARLVSSPFLTA